MDETFTAAENRLLTQADFNSPYAVRQIKAGRNNQVFRVRDRTGRLVVLKRYFHHAKDVRDRLEHEWRFLEYAETVAGSFVPRPLARCRKSRAALIEWKEGRTFSGEPEPDEIFAAFEFARRLNPHNREEVGKHLPDAADACFGWEDHISLLRKRVERLELIADPNIRKFVDRHLRPAALESVDGAMRLGDSGTSPRVNERVISPSDFGYHNALRIKGEVPCFIDFEYAGWDGIGKLVADFFSQPEIPVPSKYLPAFENILFTDLDGKKLELLQRSWCGLFAVHAMKWCCILLNGFTVVDGARREFAGETRSRDEQFNHARSYFDSVCLPRLNTLTRLLTHP